MDLVPWKQGKHLLWDVTVVDVLALSCFSAGLAGNPGIAAVEAEERKNDKYKSLVEKGYLIQPFFYKLHGSAGPSTEAFWRDLCKTLCIMKIEPRAVSFLKQRTSLEIQITNAARVLDTVNNKTTVDDIFLIQIFFSKCVCS